MPAIVATVLASIPTSSDTVESEGRQMKQCRISYIKRKKKKKSGPLRNISQIRMDTTVPRLAEMDRNEGFLTYIVFMFMFLKPCC
jgi:hypothetical protein